MKRVFIFSSRTLFSSGIKNLLDAEPDLKVVGWEVEAEKASKCIQELQPDTILVITRGAPNSAILEGQRFLGAGVNTKIVELNLESNNVYVYSGERIMVKEVGDLVRAIEEHIPFPFGMDQQIKKPDPNQE